MGITSQMVTSIGLPSAAILGLFSLVALGVRWIMVGKLMPRKFYDEMRERFEAAIEDRDKIIEKAGEERDRWRSMAEALEAENADLLTNQDMSLQAWNAIKAHVQVKESEA